MTAQKNSAPRLADPGPNVIVIEIDDQTADSIRVMPNLHLVEAGPTFDNSFVSYRSARHRKERFVARRP